MDETLVRLEEISTRDEVQRLTFRDLTIDCGNDSFTDMRHDKPVTIRLERCRVVGFDSGAGGSVMLAARTAAFYATDCRIEAGYGRHADGNLFRVGRGLQVRMENCVFVGPFNSILESNQRATYHFERCDFDDMSVFVKRSVEHPPQGARFVDCAFRYLPDDYRPTGELRSLSEINPAWR